MSLYSVRKIHVQIEEIRHDGGPPPVNRNYAARLRR